MSSKTVVVIQPEDLTKYASDTRPEQLAADVFLDDVLERHPEFAQGETEFFPFFEIKSNHTKTGGLRTVSYGGIIYKRRTESSGGNKDRKLFRFLCLIAAKQDSLCDNYSIQGTPNRGQLEIQNPSDEMCKTLLQMGLCGIYERHPEIPKNLRVEIRKPEKGVLLSLDTGVYVKRMQPYLEGEGYMLEMITC